MNRVLPRYLWVDSSITYLRYVSRYRRLPNFQNPSRFTELAALQRISYTDLGLQTFTSDKHLAKQYIHTRLAQDNFVPEDHIIKTLEVIRDLTDDRLNAPFSNCIMKTTHNSGLAIVFRDERKLSDTEARLLRKRFFQNYFYSEREYNYISLTPKVLVEQLLIDELGELPKDFKIFCYEGFPFLFQIDFERRTGHKRKLFSVDWHEIEVLTTRAREIEEMSPPNNLDLMLRIARCLARDFKFVRIDLYSIGEKVYVGEITHVPWGGFLRLSPDEVDLTLFQMAIQARLHPFFENHLRSEPLEVVSRSYSNTREVL